MKNEITKGKVKGIVDKLNHSEMKEIVEILNSELDREKEVRDEMVRECFLLSKKDVKLPF